MYLSFSVSVIISGFIHVGEMAIFHSFYGQAVSHCIHVPRLLIHPSVFGHLGCFHVLTGASLVAQTVKNLPAMQETWVQSLGREDPLEKGMATNSSILAWRIPWTEEPSRIQSVGLQRVVHD